MSAKNEKTTRLDRLFKLLESGSEAVTKNMAATQIADMAKMQLEQLPAFVWRLYLLLSSKEWETRVAAAKGLGLIAASVRHPSASDLTRCSSGGAASSASAAVKQEEGQGLPAIVATASPNYLTLLKFDLHKVITRGKQLLATSDDKDFALDPEVAKLSPAERLAAERRNLEVQLGLENEDEAKRLGFTSRDLVTDEDLLNGAVPSSSRQETGEEATAVVDELAGLSARERARLKRKAKQAEKAAREGPRQKRQKVAGEGEEEAASADAAWPWSFEDHVEAIGGGTWPLQPLVDELAVDLLNSRWEVRHGAAAALREILLHCADRAGVEVPSPDPELPFYLQGEGAMDLGHLSTDQVRKALQDHMAWLEDFVLRCVSVLALDRFGDYMGDRVVGPVRETAAQALGTSCRALPDQILSPVLSLLATLASRPEWEVRHGAQLGLQYFLASRPDLCTVCSLASVLQIVKVGLADKEDDNAAVAADSIIAILPDLAADAEAYRQIRADLLTKLSALEDLSPTGGAILATLGEMYSKMAGVKREPAAAAALQSELASVVPRALPFLFHTLRTVRRRTAVCLLSILRALPAPLQWLASTPLLQDLLRCTWTELLVEPDAEVVRLCHAILTTAIERAPQDALQAALADRAILQGMLALASTPHGAVLDPALVPQRLASLQDGAELQHRNYEVGADPTARTALGMRLWAARSLAVLLRCAPPALRPQLHFELGSLLNRCSQGSRLLAALTLHFAVHPPEDETAAAPALDLDPSLDRMVRALLTASSASSPSPSNPNECYEEVSAAYARLSLEVGALVNHCTAIGLAVAVPAASPSGRLPIDPLTQVVTELAIPTGTRTHELAAAVRERVLSTCATLKFIEQMHHTSVTAALAATLVATGTLPDKVTQVIQPLMGSLKGDLEFPLQELSGWALARVLDLCAARTPCPNPKVLQNLLKLVLGDRTRVPDATQPDPGETGGPALIPRDDTAPGLELTPPEVARRGGDAALRAIARRFGKETPARLPDLWKFATETLASAPSLLAADPVVLVEGLAVLRAMAPALDPPALSALLLPLLPRLCEVLRHPNWAARRASTLLLATAAVHQTDLFLPGLLKVVLPMTGDTSDEGARAESVRLLLDLSEALGHRLVPYVVLLLLPLMARMSDPTPGIRLMAARAFGALVPLLALAQGSGSQALPAGLDEDQRKQAEADAQFLAQLLDSKCAEEFPLPVPLRCDLRPYQKEGINWLAFLKKFGLHGVLADDMGLGKTLQASAIIGSAMSEVEAQLKARASNPAGPAPSAYYSLVVCPATLVQHWAFEINKFVDASILRPLPYEGNPAERQRTQKVWATGKYNVLITSYEVLRSDVAYFSRMPWLYCVLDEGHVIKNPKSKTAQACYALNAKHRLVLSGTPIQNGVEELWAIFQFLMPGFLGTEKQFHQRYGKAVKVARGQQKGSKELEKGLAAAEDLHRQVMPFILRRTKDQVLKDLPPKTITDRYCDLSPLQQRLYVQFGSSKAAADVQTVVQGAETGGTASLAAMADAGEAGGGKGGGGGTHVFQALQYLRKLCSHPLMVLDAAVPDHVEAVRLAVGDSYAQRSAQWPSLLGTWDFAPKLRVLRDILRECGLGNATDIDAEDAGGSSDAEAAGGDEAGHRVLIFCQMRPLLDLIATHVLDRMGITHLRIDGSVEASQRFKVVQRFNSDPTIDVLLLTTHVGGLGLNLTSADTVVFMEHDWNPMKDLQAMDRAHRLGQKRRVNVFRVLTRGTLEEKIMGLQRFKLDVANAVINKDNISLKSMDAGKLLDLFQVSSATQVQGGGAGGRGAAGAIEGVDALGQVTVGGGEEGGGAVAEAAGGNAAAARGVSALLEGVEKLWDDSMYEEEFDLKGFMNRMKK